MAWKFNNPPGWPPQPPDWKPPDGWTPDPSWPPAPEGWDFWVPDGTTAAPEPAYVPTMPVTAPPPPPKRKKTFLWIALGGAGAVAIACCGFQALTGSSDDKDNQKSGQGGGAPVASPATVAIPGIGEPVRDGKFEFIVKSVECDVPSVGDGGLGKSAQGQFCLVNVSVKNIGTEPQTLFDSAQKGVGSNGAKYNSDSSAGFYANDADSSVWLTEINPGNEVTGVIVFDLPKGVTLDSLELHDSSFSGGVKVQLK